MLLYNNDYFTVKTGWAMKAGIIAVGEGNTPIKKQ
jgi:hypothetical protein